MRRIFCILLLAALALPAAAQPARFNWEYGADFRYIFDNREFAYSNAPIGDNSCARKIYSFVQDGYFMGIEEVVK